MSRFSFAPLVVPLILLPGSSRPFAQELTVDPFPTPIETKQGVIAVSFAEFATIPDVNGEARRMMHMVAEPGTKRLFVSPMS